MVMTRSSSKPTRELETINPSTLTMVVGGRIVPRTTLDPVLLQGLQQLSQAIISVGQNLASAKQSSMQMLMQMIQQMRGR